jgi:hypothetical protein
MRTNVRGLVVWTLAMCLGRVAIAQEPGPPPDEAPQSYEPPPVDIPPVPPGPPVQPGPPGAPPLVAGAPAVPPAAGAGLGELGQLAISDDLQVSAIRDTSSRTGVPTASLTSVQLAPALDFFVAPNVSVGGQLRIGFISSDPGGGTPSTDTTVIGLLPRVGYVVPFSPTSYLWPRAGIGYVHTSTGSSGQTSVGQYRVPLEIFVPVIFQPVPHFFIGGGIRVATDLVSKVESVDGYKTTEIGLLSTIGGYLSP